MLAGRRYRLEFTPEQTDFADSVGDACRAVWNTGLEQRREYRRRGAWINYHQQAAELVEAEAEHAWLKDAPGHCLQQTLMDLDRACRTHGTFKVRWRSARRWSPSFRFPEGGKIEDGQKAPEQHPSTSTVGVDRGVACSDGTMADREFVTAGEMTRHRRLRQKLARQRKGSANRRKTIARMRVVRKRERDRRADFAAQLACMLTARHSLVALEDLTNAARYSGTKIVKVPAAFTSQTCSSCRSVDSRSRESQTVFRCITCGHSENADVNAAKNILAAGLAVSAGGDLGVARSAKQEPLALAG